MLDLALATSVPPGWSPPVYARALMRGASLPLQSSLRALAFCSFVLSASIAGCPDASRGPDIGRLPLLTSASPQAESELRQARELAESGDREGSEARYRRFIQKRPDDPLVPVARLALGRLLSQRGRIEEAHALFAEVAVHPDASVAEQGRFYGGVTSHALGRHRQAIDVLRPMLGRTIDPQDTSLLLTTLTDAMVATGDYAGAITTLDRLLREAVADADRQAARTRLVELVRDRAKPTEIALLYQELPDDGAAWPYVLRRAAHDADAAHDTERVRELVEEMRDHNLDIGDELALVAMRAAGPTDANPQVIGAVLTLSGRARHVGELALRGLMLAANLPPKGPLPPDAPQLVFRDDAGDPERAAKAVEELVSVHHAIAILGPIDARAAEAAAARAQELGVPLIALAPGADLGAKGAFVYRLFATPRAEIEELTAYARSTGAVRFAALVPEGPFGDAMASALTAAAGATAAGATRAASVPVVRYPAEATSFGAQATALAKLEFDALLVADRAAQVSLIAPALAAAGLWSGAAPTAGGRRILLLAPGVAFEPGLARSVGRYLQGAVFSVPFDATTAADDGAAFVEDFRAQFGDTPDAFAAFAHDAYRLARGAVERGARTRADLARMLLSERGAKLAGPSPGFTAAHEPLRPTRLLRLDGERFVPVPRPP